MELEAALWRLRGRNGTRLRPWTPLWLLFGLFRLATNFFREICVFRLLRYPGVSGFALQYPKFLFRPNAEGYLCWLFTPKQRIESFNHHYQTLYQRLTNAQFRSLFESNAVVMTLQPAQRLIEVRIGASRKNNTEGELSAYLLADGYVIYTLSFTCIPGAIVGVNAPHVLLVSRLQGSLDCYEVIRQVTRDLQSVNLSAYLLATMQGFAEVLGVDTFVGVPAVAQATYKPEKSSAFYSAYDNFYCEIGGVPNADGFYIGQIPFPEKPLSEVSPGNRSRRKKQRQLKRDLAESVVAYLRNS